MLKLLLIDANSYWLVNINRNDLYDLDMIIPPIGLMSIATYLKHRFKNSIEVKVISQMVDCNSESELIAILREYNPDVVGIRGLQIFKKMFHETAAVVKQFRDEIIVVGGGPYVMDIQEAIKDKNIDYFVMGEGEITLAQMLGRLLTGREFRDIKGIAFRDGEKIIINPLHEFIENLDTLPFPDYNLISLDKYCKFINYGYNRRRQAVIFSSRGCPYGCIYCHNIFGKKFRSRSPENVFSELEDLYKNFNIRDFGIVDDVFNLDYHRAMKIFDLIIDSNMKLKLYFPNGMRGDIIDPAFIDKMVKAGVILVAYAIETGSPRLQKLIKKFINLEKLADNIHYTCGKNIMVHCFFMIGFPTETKEEALQTIEYAKQFKKIIIPYFESVKYFPNTEIYDLALREGIKMDNIKDTYTEPYHKIHHSRTPLLPEPMFRNIFLKFLNEVFLSKERLHNAIEIQRRFLTEQEILDIYSMFFRKRIKDLEKDVLCYAR